MGLLGPCDLKECILYIMTLDWTLVPTAIMSSEVGNENFGCLFRDVVVMECISNVFLTCSVHGL